MMLLWCAPSSMEDIVLAARKFVEIAAEYCFTQSNLKTNLLLAGLELTNDDLGLSGDLAEVHNIMVEHFKYFGSLVKVCGGIVGDVGCKIAQASRAFAVFIFLCLLQQTCH